MSNAKRNQKNKQKNPPGPKVGGQKNNTQKKKNKNNGSPTVSAPAAIATGVRTRNAIIASTENSTVVSKREFVGDFSIPFTNQFGVADSFPLNPGMQKTFPWLAAQAQCWEKYYFEYLRFYVYTRASTTSVGSWILAPDMDAADAAPVSEQVACAYSHAVEDALWKDLVCHVPCDRVKRYTRGAALSANLDIKTYDMGNMHACYAGATTNATFGKIWVEYKVRFFVPQLPPTGLVAGGSVQGGGTLTGANPLGTLPVLNAASSSISVDGASQITFNKLGTYLTSMNLGGTGITSAGAPIVTSGNATIANSGLVNAGSTASFVKSEVQVNSIPSILNFANGVLGTTITSSHLDVANAPSFSL